MTERSVPRRVYLDTSLVVAAMFPGLPNATASLAFCAELAARRSRIYFSQVLRLEISQAVRNLASRPNQVDLTLGQHFQLDQWDGSRQVRHDWMMFGLGRFEAFLRQFNRVNERPFHGQTWQTSVDIMVEHRLRSLDAAHVATARESRIVDFATLDDHFNRITDLTIWLIRDH